MRSQTGSLYALVRDRHEHRLRRTGATSLFSMSIQQKDLEQRRVSEDLQRVVSALERMEGLLCDVIRVQSMVSCDVLRFQCVVLTSWVGTLELLTPTGWSALYPEPRQVATILARPSASAAACPSKTLFI